MNGAQRSAGTTGANNDTTGVPTAAARCAGPVLPTTTAAAPAKHAGQFGQGQPTGQILDVGRLLRTDRSRQLGGEFGFGRATGEHQVVAVLDQAGDHSPPGGR